MPWGNDTTLLAKRAIQMLIHTRFTVLTNILPGASSKDAREYDKSIGTRCLTLKIGNPKLFNHTTR